MADITIYTNDQIVKCNKSPWKGPKKITATTFAGIIGASKFASPFTIWAQMLKLYKPFFDEKYTIIGNDIEPKIIARMEEENGYSVLTHNPFDIQFDNFKNEPVFGGMYDGYVEDQGLVIECKTTQKSGKNFWKDNLKSSKPEYYWQLQLYMSLLGAKKGVLAVAFIDDEYYSDGKWHEICNVQKESLEMKYYHVEIDPEIEEQKARALKWYNKHIKTMTSPQFETKLKPYKGAKAPLDVEAMNLMKEQGISGEYIRQESTEQVVMTWDLETTGFVDNPDSEIIEIAALFTKGGEEIGRFETFVKPVNGIPPVITNLTNITEDMVVDAPGQSEAIQNFIKAIKLYNPQIMAGHNIACFDIPFIEKIAINNDMYLELVEAFSNMRIHDTLVMAREKIEQGQTLNYKLETVAAYYNIPLDGAHRAINDVEANAKIYQKLKLEY